MEPFVEGAIRANPIGLFEGTADREKDLARSRKKEAAVSLSFEAEHPCRICATMTVTNPRIEVLQRMLQSSYDALNRLIAGPLIVLDPAKLYLAPSADEWTIMENIAHIVEFMPYWANEIVALVAEPGKNFGRTVQDERRLQGVRDHSTDTLAQAAAALSSSFAYLNQVLHTLTDSDLAIKGQHSRFGEQSLEWFIEEFVAKHLTNHVEQMRTVLVAKELE